MSNSNTPIVTLEKASGGPICRGHKCSKNDKYISQKGSIISGTTCAVIDMSPTHTYKRKIIKYYFCKDCIDWLFTEFKKALDPKLRPFT